MLAGLISLAAMQHHASRRMRSRKVPLTVRARRANRAEGLMSLTSDAAQ